MGVSNHRHEHLRELMARPTRALLLLFLALLLAGSWTLRAAHALEHDLACASVEWGGELGPSLSDEDAESEEGPCAVCLFASDDRQLSVDPAPRLLAVAPARTLRAAPRRQTPARAPPRESAPRAPPVL
ncbi:MAG TPA: hypothetical protein DEA08_36730 [Planctomycetes bacterium]|nr:hypothetical protein [Planctomycetota bacterium]